MNAKRILVRLCLLCAALLPPVAQAQFTFTTNNGAITITGYTGRPTVLVIPSTTNGLPVTSIGTNAFFGCSTLTSVTISNSVTSIGIEAFADCTSLTTITVAPNNPAFSSVVGVLFNKSQTSLIAYPEGLRGGYTIPSSVTSIGTLAFYVCYYLNSVTIPNSVTNIGDKAFFDCGTLTGVTIPGSVTSIGIEAFFGCSRLTSITVNTNNPAYSSLAGVLFNKDQTTLVEFPAGLFALNYKIPNSVTSIGDSAFNYCPNLLGVTIPNSVTNIGNFAFCQCKWLDSVVVPNSVVNIGSYAFAYCATLTSVIIPNSVTSIGVYAFSSCPFLHQVYFQGNAPGVNGGPGSADNTLFYGEFYGTAYYLPGTTGWSSTFGGWPTALWLPQVQTTGVSIGVRTNQFGYNINWASGQTVVVEACTNFVNPVWQPVATNKLTSGSSYFSDPQWTNYPGRFYRLRSP